MHVICGVDKLVFVVEKRIFIVFLLFFYHMMAGSYERVRQCALIDPPYIGYASCMKHLYPHHAELSKL